MKIDKIQNFEQKAYEFVSLFEGFESRAYYDSEGIPTIGYGFNLTQPSPCKLLENQLSYQGQTPRLDWMTYTKQIKDLKFEKSKSKKDEYTLRQEGVLKDTNKWKEILEIFDASYEKKLTELPHSITLNKAQLSQKKKALSSILQTYFPFMITKEKAKGVLQKLIPEYSQILENRMSTIENFKLQKQQIQALKGSYEWIALLSLSYTNPSSLIGPKLCLALKNNDRFRAWFEIRYQSNKDKDIGLAKRRFAESNCFGLFDGYKRGEFKKTLWKQEKEFGEDALEIFESLHSLREGGKEETYLEFIRLYESGKLFKTGALKKLEEPNDFKFHFAPYTNVFSPFAEALKQAFGFQESIKSELPLVDRILVLNTEGQLEKLKDKIRALIQDEIDLRDQYKIPIPSQSPFLDIYIISHQVQKSPLSITSYPQANLHFYLKDGAKIDIRPSQSQGENLFFHAFALLKETDQQVKEWIQTFPIIGSSSQPLKSQSDALIVQGTDSEGKASPLLYSFEKEDKAYSSTLKVTTPFGDQKICFYNLPFQDYTLTQQTQQACNISLCLPTSLQSHSTDSSLQEDYQASKQSTKASKADFFIRTHHYHTKNPLSGIKLSYNKKEAITDDEGIAYFCFDIKRSWEAFRIYPILIQSEEYIAPSNITYTCSMASCSSKQEAYHLALLKKGHASFKEMSLMFDFGDYPIKEISIPTKDLKTFKQTSGVKELTQDFFLDSVISVWQIKRNFIKIQKDRTCIAHITYKKEFLTHWDTGLILDEKDFRHLQSTLESNDIDLYEFQDEQDYFYLQEIAIRTSCEGKSASNEIEDTLTLKANFSKPHSKTSQTQWGYISFAKGVEILKELYHLRDKDALPIDQARGFQILKDANGEDLQGEEIKLSCPLEWKDRQVLLFGYLNTPSLKHSILLLPSSIQEEDEEIIITSLESKHDEEYIKFTFPANPTPPAEEVMQCDEFMIDDIVCELKALSLQESKESQDDQPIKQENLKKYITRFSKELSQKGRREVEFDKELDDFFIYASRNAKSTSSKINQNKSKVEEALLEDGTKITRSKAYREFNKIEQSFLDSAVLVQVEGRSVAQRTQVIDLGAVSLANMKSGKAPRGIDGEPIELHHLQQKEDGILLELTKTEHRDNSRALHSYKKTSEIDRIGFARFKKRYWKARFDGLGI